MTPITERLDIGHPIIQAPMAGVQGSALAIAVSNAGGLGSLPCAMLIPDQMRAGLAAILAGTALLLQALGALPIGWDLVLPLMLIVVGAVTATTGILGAARAHHH